MFRGEREVNPEDLDKFSELVGKRRMAMALNDKGHLSDGELKNGVEAIDKEITAIRERSPGVKKAFLKRKEEVQRVRENIRRQRDLD